MPLIRARDLRANIKEMGFERGVVHTLELFMEEHAQDRQHLREIIDMTAHIVDELEKLDTIAGAMRDSVDEIRRIQRQGDQHDGEHG